MESRRTVERGIFGRGFHAVLHVYERPWFQVYAAGLFLLFLMEAAFLVANNDKLIPGIIIYGAFLVPVTALVYLYERLVAWEIPTPILLICFLYAGGLGLTLASTLEIESLDSMGSFKFFGVGLIEESAKMIVPLIVFFVGAYRSEAAGVMVGFTSAMGFSALETAGYGFDSYVGASANVKDSAVAEVLEAPLTILQLDITLILRSVIDPIGHGVWTILICYVLFHERRKAGRMVFNWRVGGAFVLAVLLHAGWDNSLVYASSGPLFARAAAVVAFLLMLAVTLWLLVRIVHKTRRDMGAET